MQTNQDTYNRLINFFLQHLQAAITSLGQLTKKPFTTLLTTLVIGISLTLPTALYILLNNLQQLNLTQHKQAQFSLFLKQDISNDQIKTLLNKLQNTPNITKVTYITPEKGLTTLAQELELGDSIHQLGFNPIPGLIKIQSNLTLKQMQNIYQLKQSLATLPETDQIKTDIIWLQRLQNIFILGKHAILLLTLILSIGVILIIGNTINLAIQQYKTQIKVYKLVGATNSFIRRPFLYTGILYGLLGSIITCTIISTSILWLRTPITLISQSYGNIYYLNNLNAKTLISIVTINIILGMLGAWIAVYKGVRAEKI